MASDVEHQQNCTNTHLDTALLDLPPELLVRIFSKLDLKTLFQRVILVCKAFHTVLSTEGIWKTIFPLKWGESVQLTHDLDYINDWRNVYRSYDNVDTFWKSKERKLLVKNLQGHYAAVDSVHMMNQGSICISGARDRTAVVWDISCFRDSNDELEIKSMDCPKVATLEGHSGWVWTINSDKNNPNEIVTGCWDSKLRTWDLGAGATLKDTFRYHPAAVLCLQARDGCFFTGCYDKRVRIFDPRQNSVVQEFTCHKRAVLSLELLDHFIISGSEDKLIGIYDQRMCKYLASIHVDCSVLCLNVATDLGYSYLRAGGAAGSLYTYDTSQSRFTLLKAETLWNNYKVTSLCNFYGALIACSQSGKIHAYEAGRCLQPLSKPLQYAVHTGDISDAHASYGVLATGSVDDTVGLWKFQDI